MSGGDTGRTPLSIDDYRRLRQGYERGINPDALEKIGQNGGDATGGATPQRPAMSATTSRDAEHLATGGAGAVGASSTRPTPEAEVMPVENLDEARAAGRVVTIRPETYTPRESLVPDRRSSRAGRIGPIGILLIGAVGIFGGLFLYAGGSDVIASWFSETEEQVDENPTLVTERPGAFVDGVLPDESPTPGEEMAATEEEEGVEEAVLAAAEEEEIAEPDPVDQTEQVVASIPSSSERETEAVTPSVTEQESTGAPRATETAEETVVESRPEPTDLTPTSAASTRRYVAQVGATSDRAEADRIAAALRSRGGSGVRIESAEKNGETIYRVRFGSFTSEEEARRSGSKLGYPSVWVVPGG